MRIFSYIVAGIAVVAAPILWTLVHRYTAMYQELEAQLPVATRSLVATGGWLPVGILGAIAILVILAASGRSKGLALVAAIMGLIGILAVVGITFLLALFSWSPRALRRLYRRLSRCWARHESSFTARGNPVCRLERAALSFGAGR